MNMIVSDRCPKRLDPSNEKSIKKIVLKPTSRSQNTALPTITSRVLS